LAIGYESLQSISNPTDGGNTLPINVILVANSHVDMQGESLGGELSATVAVSSIQAGQSMI